MKQFLMAAIAVFVLLTALMYLVMEVILGPDVAALGGMLRSPDEISVPTVLLSNVITAAALTWIYSQGVRAGKSWVGQGLRFGFAAWLFRPAAVFLLNYSVMAFPGAFIAKQIAYTLPPLLIVSLAAAYFYRGSAAAA